MTFNGIVLMVICLSVAGSGFRSLRVEAGGLLVHPYLVIAGTLFPLVFLSRAAALPMRLVAAMGGFAAIYYLSTFAGGVSLGEGVKVCAAVATILTAAMLVRSWHDFFAGVLGLCLAMGFLGLHGLEVDQNPGGAEAIEVANRNAYSLFALPAILLGVFVLLRAQCESLLVKALICISVTTSAVAIAVNLNRSGWLGLVLIASMMLRMRSWRAKFWLAAVTALATVAVAQLADFDLLEERVERTIDNTNHDDFRVVLFLHAIDIGLENPLLGISPQMLQMELARRCGMEEGYLDAHNVFAHVVGGSGLICLALLISVGWLLWRRPILPGPPAALADQFTARGLLRMMLVLWCVRGMFTHEILYSPGFCFGLGMCLGLLSSVTPQLRLFRQRHIDVRHAELE
jgi:hypothetical protein